MLIVAGATLNKSYLCNKCGFNHRSSNPRFVETLRQIQRQPKCKSMNLLSYLLEPLQRFIRYPLLLKEVIKHLSDNEEERSRAEIAHETIEKVRIKSKNR